MSEEIMDFLKARDKAVIECWKKDSVNPLNKFFEDYELYFLSDSTLLEWNKGNDIIKWLIICEMTLMIASKEADLSIISKEVEKYANRAFIRQRVLSMKYYYYSIDRR